MGDSTKKLQRKGRTINQKEIKNRQIKLFNENQINLHIPENIDKIECLAPYDLHKGNVLIDPKEFTSQNQLASWHKLPSLCRRCRAHQSRLYRSTLRGQANTLICK